MANDNINAAILHCSRRGTQWALTLSLLIVGFSSSAGTILFIGNSFTFALGQGGVPALFKSFTTQAGLSRDVYLETEPGVGIDWHLEHKLDVSLKGPGTASRSRRWLTMYATATIGRLPKRLVLP